jgi:hypothetical protein
MTYKWYESDYRRLRTAIKNNDRKSADFFIKRIVERAYCRSIIKSTLEESIQDIKKRNRV